MLSIRLLVRIALVTALGLLVLSCPLPISTGSPDDDGAAHEEPDAPANPGDPGDPSDSGATANILVRNRELVDVTVHVGEFDRSDPFASISQYDSPTVPARTDLMLAMPAEGERSVWYSYNRPDNPSATVHVPLVEQIGGNLSVFHLAPDASYVLEIGLPRSNYRLYRETSFRVAPPVLIVTGGSDLGPARIRMESASRNVTIRYTTDGSDPSLSFTARDYRGPVILASNASIKAYARAPAGTELEDSETVVASFTVAPEATADTVAPVVTAFTGPTQSEQTTVWFSELTGSDDHGIVAWAVTTSNTPPAADDPAFDTFQPEYHAFSYNGTSTLYAWAKDAAGNVSESTTASRFTVEVNADHSAPAEVADLVARVANDTVELSWTDPVTTDLTEALITYDNGAEAVSFRAVPGLENVSLEAPAEDATFQLVVQTVDDQDNVSLGVRTSGVAGGFFHPYRFVHEASRLERLAVGDVNGDGRWDVVGANLYHGPILVFPGTADGELAAPVGYATPPGTQVDDLAVGDLDGDGRSDVAVVSRYGDFVGYYLQEDDGTLAAISTIEGAGTSTHDYGYRVQIGDVSGDGASDIVVLTWASLENFVRVYRNVQGTISTTPDVYEVAHNGRGDLRIADVSGDGLNDVIVTDGQGTNPHVSVLVQSDGLLGAADEYVSTKVTSDTVRGLAVADIDGNGSQEVLLAFESDGGISGPFIEVFEQDGAGGLVSSRTIPVSGAPEMLELFDIDDDGDMDMLYTSGFDYSVHVYLQLAGGTFQPHSLYEYRTAVNDMRMADVVGDGSRDLVLLRSVGEGLGILEGTTR